MVLEGTVHQSPQRLILGLGQGEALFSVREFMSPTMYGDSAVISKNERSIAMKMNRVLRASVFAVLLTFFLLPAAARAANVTVGCGGVSGTYDFTTITAALNAIGQTGPSTITVSGTCQEKVSLNNARSITIISGPSGAAVVGPLDSDTFDISLSQDITLWSLDISGTFSTTANGGGAGVSITEASDVHILGCNIHDTQADGVIAAPGSIVFLRGTTIQNNTPNDGLDVTNNSAAYVTGSTVQYNGSLTGASGGHSAGIFAASNSVVDIIGQRSFVQYNAERGIVARD